MPPVNLLIKPASSLCNMRCRYCFYCDVAENRNTASYGIMSPAVTEALVKNVFAHAKGSVSISFQGGEPTLAGAGYFRHFHEMVDKYNTARLPTAFSMQTNGYRMPEELAQILAEHKYLLGVSMDGMGKLHDILRPDSREEGTFRRVNETLHTLEKYGIDYNILCVITEQIAKNGAEVYKYFRSRNFKFVQFIPYVPDFGRESENHPFTLTNKQYARFLSTTFRLYYEDFCRGQYISVRQFDNFIRLAAGMPTECCGMDGICHANLVVEADGSVYPCDFYVLDEWKIGNVNDHSIEEMFSSDTAQSFLRRSLKVDDACRQCRYFRLCRGGCARYREPSGENGLKRNKYCESYREFFDASMNKILRMAASLNNQK